MDAGTHYNDGYISVQARADDVINVAGHRIAASSLEEVCKESIIMDIFYIKTSLGSTSLLWCELLIVWQNIPDQS